MDLVVIIPFRVYATFAAVDLITFKHASRLVGVIELRAKRILRRTTGVILSFNDAVQHFNPACKAARMQTMLSVSKLLMALNDSDFSFVLKNRRYKRVSYCRRTMK